MDLPVAGQLLRRWAPIVVPAAVYLVLPRDHLARPVLTAAVAVAASAVAWHGAARLERAHRWPWLLVAASLTVWALAEIVFGLHVTILEASPEGIEPATLLYTLASLLLTIGVWTVARRRAGRDPGAVIDAGVLVVTVGLVTTLLLVTPLWDHLADSTVGLLQLVLYPSTHLLLLAAIVRLALGRGRLTPASRLLVLGGTVVVVEAMAVGAQVILGIWQPRGPAIVLAIAAYVLLARATVEVRTTPRPDPTLRDATTGSRLRILLLAGAMLMVPGLQVAHDRSVDSVLFALATAGVLGLVSARMWLMIRELDRLRAREVQVQRDRDRRRFEALIRHATDVLLVIDRDDVVTYASPSAVEVLGDDPAGWEVERLTEMIHPDERQATVSALRERLGHAEGKPVRINARLRDRDDREHHVEVVAVDLRHDPDVAGTVLTLHETTERAELERRLRHLAFHDPLTGLANRQLLRDRLDHALGRAARTGRQVAVLLCDLDDFKDINDTLGHSSGDTLLRVLAERLTTVTRASDTVARIGGDEFAVLCEDLTGARDAVTMARRLLEAIDQPLTLDGHEVTASASIGIAVDTGERSADELLRDADVALYDAKAEGKQRWSLHRAAMTARARTRLRLAGELATAIDDGSIGVAFQPIVALPTGRIVGVECLARWEHPTRGTVSPADFIPVAEQTGLVVDLGDRILERSLAAVHGWLEDRPGATMQVGVNVSARQLREPTIVGRIAELLARYEIPPSWLVLELTESVMLDDVELARTVMRQLRAFGVRFAVDDFGTGYSSLAYLRRLPVDTVKIDRDFIAELGSDDTADDLVRAIIELGRSLRLDVVAEGVETEAQRTILEALGCGFAQGYLFQRPVPAAELATLLTGPEPRLPRSDPDRPTVPAEAARA